MTKQTMAIFRRSVRLSGGNPGQFGCLLGLATSILIDGHVISDRLSVYGGAVGLRRSGMIARMAESLVRPRFAKMPSSFASSIR